MNVVILILDSGGTIRQFKNIQNETKKSESLRFPIFLPSYMRTVYSIIQYVLQLFIISYCLSRCFTSLSLGLLFPARVICGAHCSAYERKRNLVFLSFRSADEASHCGISHICERICSFCEFVCRPQSTQNLHISVKQKGNLKFSPRTIRGCYELWPNKIFTQTGSALFDTHAECLFPFSFLFMVT